MGQLLGDRWTNSGPSVANIKARNNRLAGELATRPSSPESYVYNKCLQE